jgi:hypothetical protein
MVATWVEEMGGDRAVHRWGRGEASRERRPPPPGCPPPPAHPPTHPTRRSVLIANNGLAAVKFIRSVRSWAYKTFGSSRAIALVAMATPEDIRINAGARRWRQRAAAPRAGPAAGRRCRRAEPLPPSPSPRPHTHPPTHTRPLTRRARVHGGPVRGGAGRHQQQQLRQRAPDRADGAACRRGRRLARLVRVRPWAPPPCPALPCPGLGARQRRPGALHGGAAAGLLPPLQRRPRGQGRRRAHASAQRSPAQPPLPLKPHPSFSAPAARRGHASEKPELPAALEEAGIRFLGPSAAPMAALGDKVRCRSCRLRLRHGPRAALAAGARAAAAARYRPRPGAHAPRPAAAARSQVGSTILAQAAGVPTLPWSGSGVQVGGGGRWREARLRSKAAAAGGPGSRRRPQRLRGPTCTGGHAPCPSPLSRTPPSPPPPLPRRSPLPSAGAWSRRASTSAPASPAWRRRRRRARASATRSCSRRPGAAAARVGGRGGCGGRRAAAAGVVATGGGALGEARGGGRQLRPGPG